MRKKTSTNKLPKEVNVLGVKYKIYTCRWICRKVS